jgi:hypothetical protein
VIAVSHALRIDRGLIEIDVGVDVTDLRKETTMKARRLELSSKKVEEDHELRGAITLKFVGELQEPIVIAAVRAFGMTELPAHRATVRAQM